jgi:hypothetical protein
MSRLAVSMKQAIHTTPDTVTENGAATFSTSGKSLTDFVGQAAAADAARIVSLFAPLYAEDSVLAARGLFWLRDIRGGQGRRASFRAGLRWLAENNIDLLQRLIPLVPEYGRWDDLLVFDADSKAETLAFELIKLTLDAEGSPAALCAKWMPRKGPVAVRLTRFLGVSPRIYRKNLVRLTKVVETQMCRKEFEAINFSHVPSVAMARYTKAFRKRAPIAFGQYMADLQKPELVASGAVKINVDTLYPHDVIRSVKGGNSESALVDIQWAKLKEKFAVETVAKVIVMADVSESMQTAASGSVEAIDVAVGMGIFLAELIQGPFNGMMISFTDEPRVFNVDQPTLAQKYRSAMKYKGYSTNVQGAFDALLNKAVNIGATQEDLPEYILLISDMEFNAACTGNTTNYEVAKKKFAAKGYTLPKVIFWNVNARNAQSPVRFDEAGTALVSGFSPGLVKNVVSVNFDRFTPYALALDVVNAKRYDAVEEALSAR